MNEEGTESGEGGFEKPGAMDSAQEWVSADWVRQVNHLLADLGRRCEDLEGRVADLGRRCEDLEGRVADLERAPRRGRAAGRGGGEAGPRP